MTTATVHEHHFRLASTPIQVFLLTRRLHVRSILWTAKHIRLPRLEPQTRGNLARKRESTKSEIYRTQRRNVQRLTSTTINLKLSPITHQHARTHLHCRHRQHHHHPDPLPLQCQPPPTPCPSANTHSQPSTPSPAVLSVLAPRRPRSWNRGGTDSLPARQGLVWRRHTRLTCLSRRSRL